MNQHHIKKSLPIALCTAGILLSFIAWYYLKGSISAYLKALAAIENTLPWLILVTGISISCLIAALLRSSFIAKERNESLKMSNIKLKKEIKERLQLEDSKQKLEVALLQGQKLQAMGTLASGIAHDFNNLLYAIIGYTELVQQNLDNSSQDYKNLGKVLEASKRGQDLVARIMAFSRRQHHNLEPTRLKRTIDTALSLLRPTIPTSVEIDYQNKADALIMGNQTQLHQVLVNLINNAVDAMDGSGSIILSSSILEKDDPYLSQVPHQAERTYCKIEITDTGHGMNQHTLERLFEPFYTTKEVGKGTGLGLSIVHTIIKDHNGEITVDSQLGKGSHFVIILPIIDEEQGM